MPPAVVRLGSMMSPVLLSPRVRDCLLVVAKVPLAFMYAPPVVAVPAEILAVGVPPATFMTANFAEAVDVPPTNRSTVLLYGAIVPELADCQKLVPIENPQLLS